jgi:hypothetical protein
MITWVMGSEYFILEVGWRGEGREVERREKRR